MQILILNAPCRATFRRHTAIQAVTTTFVKPVLICKEIKALIFVCRMCDKYAASESHLSDVYYRLQEVCVTLAYHLQ